MICNSFDYFEFLKFAVINLIAIFMISVKLAIPGLSKKTVILTQGYDVII